jgi:hypothetical protein
VYRVIQAFRLGDGGRDEFPRTAELGIVGLREIADGQVAKAFRPVDPAQPVRVMVGHPDGQDRARVPGGGVSIGGALSLALSRLARPDGHADVDVRWRECEGVGVVAGRIGLLRPCDGRV